MSNPNAHARTEESIVITALRSIFTGKSSKNEAKTFVASNLDKENWSREKISTRLREIKIMMTGIDYRSIRSMRAIMTNSDTKEDRRELTILEQTAQRLREEAASLALIQVDLDKEK